MYEDNIYTRYIAIGIILAVSIGPRETLYVHNYVYASILVEMSHVFFDFSGDVTFSFH